VTRLRWLSREVALAAHAVQLAEHGGSPGLRDGGLLDSALARPRHLAAYGAPDLAACAAAYGFGIARNHPFIDGNKRTALVAMIVFIEDNGGRFVASEIDCLPTMLALASGELSEAELAGWLRDHIELPPTQKTPRKRSTARRT